MATSKAVSQIAATPAADLKGDPSVDTLEQLQDMDVEISIELGRSRLTLDGALQLGEQSLIDLDRALGEPVDVRLNGKLFARGEVVTVNENFGVRLTQIIDHDAV
jgi:flagellar motor switch protein FliN